MMYELQIEWGKGITYSGGSVSKSQFQYLEQEKVISSLWNFFFFDDGHCSVITMGLWHTYIIDKYVRLEGDNVLYCIVLSDNARIHCW